MSLVALHSTAYTAHVVMEPFPFSFLGLLLPLITLMCPPTHRPTEAYVYHIAGILRNMHSAVLYRLTE